MSTRFEENIPTIDWWPSPAKINLFLHVCGRLANGYHELQTLFQLLDYGDEVGFCLRATENINMANEADNYINLVDNINNVSMHENLIYRAAKLLLPFKANDAQGVDIYLRKRIPMGGGLGGGSSNAATVLVALNQIWQCGLSNATLQSMGLSLGADVPVFINGHTAFAEGVGEKLVNITLAQRYFVVATPNVHVSTASVFGHKDLPRNTPKLDFSLYEFEKTSNDCEKLVCKQQPEVANLLHRLLHYAPSRMTGTGASVFAMFSSLEDANKCSSTLPSELKSFVCKGVDVSTLHTKLNELIA